MRLLRPAQTRLKPDACVAGRSVSWFHIWGTVGLVAGSLLAGWLSVRAGLSIAVTAAAVLVAVATFLAIVAIGVIAQDVERISSLQHHVAVIATVAITAWLAGGPVLAYVEALTLGVALFRVFGRLGCTMVGCCTGVAASVGLQYGRDHAAAGMPRALVSVPLAPFQLLDAAALALALIAGVVVATTGAIAGAGLVSFAVVYAAGRGPLEFWRGDDVPIWGRLRRSQWFLLGTLGLLGALGGTGAVPFAPWHGVVAAAGVTATAAMALAGRGRRAGWMGAGHIAEIRRLTAEAIAAETVNEPKTTSHGLRVSGGDVSATRFVTLSPVAAGDASALAQIAMAAAEARAASVAMRGNGVLHVVMS